MSELKKCPYCGEVILVEAQKCKYCREWLTEPSTAFPQKRSGKQTIPCEIGENRKNENTVVSSPVVNNQQPIVNVYTTPKEKKNGLGLTGFVLSMICLVFSWAPGVNFLIWILGLVFSAVGVFKKPRGFAIAGLVISLISILVIIFLMIFIGELADEILKELGL